MLTTDTQNEEELTKKLIIPLLQKLGYERIRYFHGNREYGKDLVFSETDRFGNRQFHAAQIKYGDITGEAAGVIDKIIGQIEDAFLMPYLEVETQLPRCIATLYICCSGKFSQNAQEKIKEKISKSFIGRLFFIDGQRINEIIKSQNIVFSQNLKTKLEILINEFDFNISICQRILTLEDKYPSQVFSGNFIKTTLEDFITNFRIDDLNISSSLFTIWGNITNMNMRLNAMMYAAVKQDEMFKETMIDVKHNLEYNLPLVKSKLLKYYEDNCTVKEENNSN